MSSYITILFLDGAGLHLASIYLRLEGFLTKTPAPFPVTHEPRKLDHALPRSDHALLCPLLSFSISFSENMSPFTCHTLNPSCTRKKKSPFMSLQVSGLTHAHTVI